MNDDAPNFPQYQPPGIPVADRKQSAPLQKLISRMFKPKMRSPKKGLHSNQNVKINHKKVKFY